MSRLTGFAVSHWADDPWARGSWSLIGRDGSPQDRLDLGAPIGTRLRIAGEATHPTRAGMTHGAYEQGTEAAVWALGQRHSRVAVVGAGMAGLAAARTLRAQGAEVIIWEARNRPGGRTAPAEITGTAGTARDPDDGIAFDLGANWLQQYDDNALARLAEQLALRSVPTDFNEPLILNAPIDPAEQIEIELRARLDAAPEGASIADVLDEWLRAPGPWDPQAVRRFVDAEIVMDSGAPLEWLSARYGFEPGVGEGDRWIVGGYRLLVDHLADGLDIRLRHPVTRITVDAGGVTLAGDAGSLRADAVIVTVPLGVLAADGIAFEPPLPGTHRAALSHLGTGRVEKAILRFDERFWPPHPAGYYRVHGPTGNCISEWLDATAVDGVPTLVGLFAGPWLDDLWTGTDEEIATRAAEVFTQAADTPPEPSR